MSSDMGANSPAFNVIVPAFRAEKTISSCLTALLDAGFRPEDVVVVDDGSPDRTGDLAKEFGVQVLRNSHPTRPARARNKGAADASGEIIVFVDADVVVHPGLRDTLVHHFTDPNLGAVIGSYDASPSEPSVISRYRNILHHATHQDAAGAVATFWSGLGAMRRRLFEAAGGFDPAWEDIEDVELGLRVAEQGGRILLDPHMQCTHLKDWTLISMFKTDMFGRAVPWTRLLLSGRLAYGVLNTSVGHRISAAAISAAVFFSAVALFWSPAAWIALASFCVFVCASARLMVRLSRIGGVLFAIRALPYHAVHYIAGVSGYLLVRFFDRKSA